MKKLISLLDATLLDEHIDHKIIKIFCTRVRALGIKPACVCVYLEQVEQIKACLAYDPIPIATVINFPHGLYPFEKVEKEILKACALGVEELDIVVPYGRWLYYKQSEEISSFVKYCRSLAGEAMTLKYIIETGALHEPENITALSTILCQEEVNFIKTSTGKMVPGATLAGVQAILEAIKTHYRETERRMGIKIAGGIRTIPQAKEYMDLIEKELGSEWLHPNVFRIGASRLMDEIKI